GDLKNVSQTSARFFCKAFIFMRNVNRIPSSNDRQIVNVGGFAEGYEVERSRLALAARHIDDANFLKVSAVGWATRFC
ncbi:hypothetical protein OFP00_37510, partial [Escherichia coli]|nr:hypothetical protein [Escherichia coli]